MSERGDYIPGIGTKAYYEEQPRSSTLRHIGIQMIAHYGYVVCVEGTGGSSMARLLELNAELVALGVKPEMCETSRVTDHVDPIERAEWIAACLHRNLIHGYGFSEEARKLLVEHMEYDGPPTTIVERDHHASQDSTLRDYVLTRALLEDLEQCEQWFDSNREEWAHFLPEA